MFNNVTYNSPLTPSLLTELSMGNDSANVAVYGPNAFVLEHNEVCCVVLFFSAWCDAERFIDS